MSSKTHAPQQTSGHSLSRCVPILSIVGLCIVVDVVGIRFVAANWELLAPYIPHALLAMGIAGMVMRARSILLNRDP